MLIKFAGNQTCISDMPITMMISEKAKAIRALIERRKDRKFAK